MRLDPRDAEPRLQSTSPVPTTPIIHALPLPAVGRRPRHMCVNRSNPVKNISGACLETVRQRSDAEHYSSRSEARVRPAGPKSPSSSTRPPHRGHRSAPNILVGRPPNWSTAASASAFWRCLNIRRSPVSLYQIHGRPGEYGAAPQRRLNRLCVDLVQRS